MGIIVPHPARLNERVQIQTRKRLFQELRQVYIDQGLTEFEANAIAWAKIRAMRFAN